MQLHNKTTKMCSTCAFVEIQQFLFDLHEFIDLFTKITQFVAQLTIGLIIIRAYCKTQLH